MLDVKISGEEREVGQRHQRSRGMVDRARIEPEHFSQITLRIKGLIQPKQGWWCFKFSNQDGFGELN